MYTVVDKNGHFSVENEFECVCMFMNEIFFYFYKAGCLLPAAVIFVS